ncbi:unnamed protein product, partial [Prorocentrum cordatum]
MSTDAVKNDVATFICDHKLEHEIVDGSIRIHKVADLCLHVLGHREQRGPLSRPAVASRIKTFLPRHVASMEDPSNLRMSESKLDVDLLPDVLAEITGKPFTAADMDSVCAKIQPELQAAAAPKRTRITVHAQAAGPSAGSGAPPAPGPAPAPLALAPAARASSRDLAPLVAVPEGAEDAAALARVAPQPQSRYANLPRDVLVQMLDSRDADMAAVKHDRANVQKRLNYYITRADGLKQKLDEARDELAATRAMVNFRPRSHPSVFGGYTLGLRRNIAHASALATARMVLGQDEDEPPNQKGRASVVTYEYRLAAAKRTRAEEYYSQCAHDFADTLDIHLLKADGTNQEAIDKSKVHVSIVHSACCEYASAVRGPDGDDVAEVTPEAVAAWVGSLVTTGDLLKIDRGTGEETLQHCLRHLQSVGCPTWRDCATARRAAGRHTVYAFGLDAGPDNVGMLSRLRIELSACPSVMYIAVFCVLHQTHLVVKDLLSSLEQWQWGPVGGDKKYWGTVATVANVWRSCGMPAKIMDAARAECPSEDIARQLFKRLPGKPLRGRWGSIAAIEDVIFSARNFVGPVFTRVLTPLLAAKERGGADVGADEEAAFKADQKNYRFTARACTNSNLWIATVAISLLSKRPLTIFLFWAQKQKKEYEACVRAARPAAYLGPTPLSLLVTVKADRVYADLQALLAEGAEESLDTWGALWHLVPDEEVPRARLLIVSLVLRALAGWRARVLERTESYPLRLLRALEDPSGAASELRKDIAYDLLRAQPGDLSALGGDLALKVRDIFLYDWATMQISGECSPRLYAWLLVLRSKLPHDTQDVEGMNSVLQRMCSIAPRMKLPLASDRMRAKMGDPIAPEECVQLHAAVLDHMASEAYAGRFAELPPLGDHAAPIAPPEAPGPEVAALLAGPDAGGAAPAAGPGPGGARPRGPPRPPRLPPAELLAARYAFGAAGLRPTFMDVAFSFAAAGDGGVAGVRPAFLMCWSHYRRVHVARGALHRHGGGRHMLHLDAPIRICRLADVAAEARLGAGLAVDVGAPMPLWRGRLKRLALQRAECADEEALEDQVLDSAGGMPEEPPADEGDVGEIEDLALHGHDAPGTPIDSEVPDAVAGAVREQLERIRSAEREAERSHGAVLDVGTVSLLVTSDGHALLVTWTQPSRRMGRPVRLDTFNRIVALMPWMQPETDYTGQYIRVHDAGFRQGRAPKGERPSLDEWVVILMKQINTQVCQGPLAPLDGEECVVCSSAPDRKVVDDGAGDLLLYRCRSCLLAWHNCCAC